MNESTFLTFQAMVMSLHQSGALDDRAVRHVVDGLRNQSSLCGEATDPTTSADLERLGSAIEEGLKP